MSKSRNLNFANFICHFGDKHEMLDLASEIVIPAFSSKFRRKYSDTEYLFLDVQLLNLASEEVTVTALAGRFVKDTQLQREQVLKDGALVRDQRTLESAPSALFVLILNNHKLVYLPETKGAPSLEAFRATAQRFLSNAHKNFVTTLHQSAEQRNEKITRKALLEQYPVPFIELIPLSSESSLEEFVKQFDLLREIHVRLIDPNGELDNNELFDDMQQSKDTLGAKSTEIIHKNSKGMSKDGAIDHLKAAAQRGNTEITLVGVDPNGDKLRGNNERFKLGVQIKEIPGTIKGAANKLFEIFNGVVNDGILKVGKPQIDPTPKISKLLE